MHCTIRKEQEKNGREESRSKDPLGGGVSYQALQALLHPKSMSCFCAGAQGTECAYLPDAGWGRTGKGLPFLSDLAGMMLDEPAFHVVVKSLAQFSVWN